MPETMTQANPATATASAPAPSGGSIFDNPPDFPVESSETVAETPKEEAELTETPKDEEVSGEEKPAETEDGEEANASEPKSEETETPKLLAGLFKEVPHLEAAYIESSKEGRRLKDALDSEAARSQELMAELEQVKTE